MSGGDYVSVGEDSAHGSDVDNCIDAMIRGIREAGDSRPFSMQFRPQSISTEDPFWAKRVGWNFVYTYHPTYEAVLNAYRWQPAIPAVLGEANYEGENNNPQTPPTTDETLRRQVLWALTSGAAGEFVGSRDWKFDDGWEQRLSTPALTQITRLRTLFSALMWWQLIPDTANELVTSGREPTTYDVNDVLESDYVTAARSQDGRLAIIYLPTKCEPGHTTASTAADAPGRTWSWPGCRPASRTISVDTSAMAAGTRAAWIDPTSGSRYPVAMSATFTTPGTNGDGAGDWLLLLTA
jgi:hypothetical protein